MRKRIRKRSVKTKRAKKPYKKKVDKLVKYPYDLTVKRPESQMKSRENEIFKKVVESKRAEYGLEPEKEPIKEVEVAGEVETKPEEIEPVRLIGHVVSVPEKETFINKTLKKLKSIFRKKQVWEGYRLSKNL